MPTINLTDAEHAAVTAAIRCLITEDKFPRASTRCAPCWQSSSPTKTPTLSPQTQNAARQERRAHKKAPPTRQLWTGPTPPVTPNGAARRQIGGLPASKTSINGPPPQSPDR
jgi:hypothetical protein